MAQLPINPIPHNMFTIRSKDKQLVGEMSMTGRLRNLYDDACDMGICVESIRTGELTYWYLDEAEYNEEGDLMFYLLLPTHETTCKTPNSKGWSIILFND